MQNPISKSSSHRSVLRSNSYYKHTDIKLLSLVYQSDHWLGAMFWYLVFICFVFVCGQSLNNLVGQYWDNPTVTETELQLDEVFHRPNFTICLDDWPNYADGIFWSPLGSTTDGPLWQRAMLPYAKAELAALNTTGSVLTQEWTLYLWLYVEYYVRLLSNAEQNRPFNTITPSPFDQQLESSIITLFSPYNVTMSVPACARQLALLSGCLAQWPQGSWNATWISSMDFARGFHPGKEHRHIYITHNMPPMKIKENNFAYLLTCKQGEGLWVKHEVELHAYASGTDLSQCPSISFACGNGACVSLSARCDGTPDCTNGRDEQKCAVCNDMAFTCGNGECIHITHVCDGVDHCTNGLDEVNCGNERALQYLCQNGMYVAAKHRCTGSKSPEACSDGSHNIGCETCKETAVNCGDGQCIHEKVLCDGVVDCYNEADEINCTFSTNDDTLLDIISCENCTIRTTKFDDNSTQSLVYNTSFAKVSNKRSITSSPTMSLLSLCSHLSSLWPPCHLPHTPNSHSKYNCDTHELIWDQHSKYTSMPVDTRILDGKSDCPDGVDESVYVQSLLLHESQEDCVYGWRMIPTNNIPYCNATARVIGNDFV